MTRVVVPVGGGGLVSGVAIALKSQRPEVEVVGVQVDDLRAVPRLARGGRAGGGRLGADDRRRDRRQAPGRADAGADRALGRRARGRRRGRRRRGDGVPARAGEAGRRGRRRGRRRGAARGPRRPAADGTTAIVLSGGNVDAGLLAQIARRHESQAGRRLVLLARAARPARARSRGCWRSSASRARTCSTSSTSARGSTSTCARPAVQLVLETRGQAHAEQVARRGPRRPATPSRARCGRRGASSRAPPITRLCLVGLRVPLDPEHEPAVRGLDRLGQLVERRVAGTIRPSPTRRRPGGGGTWCRARSSPAARAASEPESSRRRGRRRRSCRGLRRCSSWPTSSGRCWSSVPPSATLSSCIPRQIPSTGMSRSTARRASAISTWSRSGTVPRGLGVRARRRRRPGRCRRRRRGSARRPGRASRRGRRRARDPAGSSARAPPARWIASR